MTNRDTVRAADPDHGADVTPDPCCGSYLVMHASERPVRVTP
jgi:hypothetical protein